MGLLTDSTTQGQGNPVVDEAKLATFLEGQADVVLAYLFGSIVRGSAGVFSDADVAVLTEHAGSALDRVRRHLQLLERVSAYVKGRTDLVLLNTASPLLAYEVVRHGRLLYARSDEAKREFEVRARRTYFDMKPRLDLHSRAVVRRIREVGLGRGQRGDPGALEAARRVRAAIERARRTHP